MNKSALEQQIKDNEAKLAAIKEFDYPVGTVYVKNIQDRLAAYKFIQAIGVKK